MTAERRPGRRPGASSTRQALLNAAREEFAEHGFAGATLRTIAERAGVDAAMIRHHFGSKQGLFTAAMQLPFDPAEPVRAAFNGPREQVGERIARAFVTQWDSVGRAVALGMVRTATQDEAATDRLQAFLIERVLRTGMSTLMPWDESARWRANLLASQLVGLLLTRYVLRFDKMAAAPADDVVAAIAPTLQRYLTGDVSGLAREARNGSGEP